ncbi:MAG: hypothetical protein HYV09_31085 [Deltaproteobacteria bacterium]|nr:hypothetical protein [Deltaproteobacteria bacterium]
MEGHLPAGRFDIGRVIIAGDGPDTSFLGASDEQALRAPAVSGAFEAVAEIVEAFEGRVWLVSKCGPRIERRTRLWLDAHRFFAHTGLAASHLRFCRERRDKAAIAVDLGLDRFVDDRADVLRAMRGLVPRLILFGAARAEGGMIAAPDWRRALRAVTEMR